MNIFFGHQTFLVSIPRNLSAKYHKVTFPSYCLPTSVVFESISRVTMFCLQCCRCTRWHHRGVTVPHLLCASILCTKGNRYDTSLRCHHTPNFFHNGQNNFYLDLEAQPYIHARSKQGSGKDPKKNFSFKRQLTVVVRSFQSVILWKSRKQINKFKSRKWIGDKKWLEDRLT